MEQPWELSEANDNGAYRVRSRWDATVLGTVTPLEDGSFLGTSAASARHKATDPVEVAQWLFDQHSTMEFFYLSLSALGFVGFASGSNLPSPNPTELLLVALNTPDLEPRLAEGLLWLVVNVDLHWNQLVAAAASQRRQNRLGFLVSLAVEVANKKGDRVRGDMLRHQLNRLEGLRLDSEDTLFQDSMTQVQRRQLRTRRPATAAHWNLLTNFQVGHFAPEYF